MTDIFASWKVNRFVIASPELIDEGVILVILSDYKYWIDHTDELNKWCKENNCEIQGMTIVMHSAEALTAFCLRWS
jgi:hypothetical protein